MAADVPAGPPPASRPERRFSIHATDQDHVYSHLPASGDWSKPSLERKAAGYYRTPRDLAVYGDYLFMATQYDLLRYRLPSE